MTNDETEESVARARAQRDIDRKKVEEETGIVIAEDGTVTLLLQEDGTETDEKKGSKP